MNNFNNKEASECIVELEKVGVVIPAYREGENIINLVVEILKSVPSSTIVIVDDSPDDTTSIAFEKFISSHPIFHKQLHYIHRNVKGGRGSAVVDGVRTLLRLGCNAVVEMDADFSHPPDQISELLMLRREKNVDLVIASRYMPTSTILKWPLSRRVFSKCANILSKMVLQIPISDYTNGYRCYSPRAAQLIIDRCGNIGKGFISLSEILVTLDSYGYSICEIPTIFVNRVRGESSLNFREIHNAVDGLVKIKLLQRKLKSLSLKGVGL